METTLETPRREGPAATAAGPEGNFGLQHFHHEDFFNALGVMPLRTASVVTPELAPAEPEWEPAPGEKYSASQFGAFYDCANVDLMKTGEVIMDTLTVIDEDGTSHEREQPRSPRAEAVREKLDGFVQEAGLTFISSHVDLYRNQATGRYEPDDGFTYVACIGESAITMHFWPEGSEEAAPGKPGLGYFDFVIHVCGANKDGMRHEEKFQRLYDLWKGYFGSKNGAHAHPVQKIPRKDPHS